MVGSGFSAKGHVAVDPVIHVSGNLIVYGVREGCRHFDDALAAEKPILELRGIEE